MKRSTWLVCLPLVLALAACSADQGKQQLETAQFEEKQNNKEHATKLYEELISKYPGSANAKIARERLSQLKGGK